MSEFVTYIGLHILLAAFAYWCGRRDGVQWPTHDRRRPGHQDRRTGKIRREKDIAAHREKSR